MWRYAFIWRRNYAARVGCEAGYLLSGPTKVKPTYIFVGKIWIKFEWIDRIQ